jgi:hypothetical protein
VLLIPELLVHRLGRLLRPLLEGRRILAQCACDLRKIHVCLAHERVEEHILDQEGAVLPYASLVVVAVCEELDEVGEAVVSGIQGPVPGGHEAHVGTPVLRDLVWA